MYQPHGSHDSEGNHRCDQGVLDRRYTIFFLPRISKVPPGQKFLINALFFLCIVTGVGAIVGIYMGQTAMLSDKMAYWFGSQGWEFMELGRFFQFTLLAAFALWIWIIYRAVKPWLTRRNVWSVPSWLRNDSRFCGTHFQRCPTGD